MSQGAVRREWSESVWTPPPLRSGNENHWAGNGGMCWQLYDKCYDWRDCGQPKRQLVIIEWCLSWSLTEPLKKDLTGYEQNSNSLLAVIGDQRGSIVFLQDPTRHTQTGTERSKKRLSIYHLAVDLLSCTIVLIMTTTQKCAFVCCVPLLAAIVLLHNSVPLSLFWLVLFVPIRCHLARMRYSVSEKKGKQGK